MNEINHNKAIIMQQMAIVFVSVHTISPNKSPSSYLNSPVEKMKTNVTNHQTKNIKLNNIKRRGISRALLLSLTKSAAIEIIYEAVLI